MARRAHGGAVVPNLTRIREDTGSILALLSALRIRRCCELWCRSKMWLVSGVAVAGV